MKKLLFVISALILSACVNKSEQKYTEVLLNPPTKEERGFIRLSPKSQYYVDVSSVWVDSEKKNLINFDTVINLHRGYKIYENEPDKSSHSIRQPKILDCKTYKLTHIDSYIYSEFWGRGLALEPKAQANRSVILREGSSLGTIGRVICANFYKD